MQKPEKIYLENTNVSYALRKEPEKGNLRETFILNQLLNTGAETSLPKMGDFLVEGKYTLEIGGKNKPEKQIKTATQAFVVADDLEVGYGNKIPIWLFGFLY